MTSVKVVAEPFDALAALDHFASKRGDAGALATFVGYCRGRTGSAEIEALELQYYPGFTDQEVARMAAAAAAKHRLIDLLVIHRVGAIAPGEAIVLVAALSVHRAAAFAAVEELMDHLKTDAPIWKLERGPAGASWIEPTTEDHTRRAKREAAP